MSNNEQPPKAKKDNLLDGGGKFGGNKPSLGEYLGKAAESGYLAKEADRKNVVKNIEGNINSAVEIMDARREFALKIDAKRTEDLKRRDELKNKIGETIDEEKEAQG